MSTDIPKPRKRGPDELVENPSPVELTKDKSDHLRGGIASGLADEVTGAISESDGQLVKFHGIYQQDDRDQRADRMERKLEPAWSFMIRLRTPGGLLSARQWLALDRVAEEMTAGGGIKITTRQAVQLHGVLKPDLRPVLRAADRVLLDSIAACGDVNRNVMCSPNPLLSPAHAEGYRLAGEISEKLLPHSRAYHEIWLGEERVAGGESVAEPLYGKHYLPRKFKIALAVPPRNDTDVFSNDVGFIAIVDGDSVEGYNVCLGGGLGMTFGDKRTHPRLADVIGFVPSDRVVDVAYHAASIQRDYGNRSDRKIARFKYTVDALGIDRVKSELEERLGGPLAEARPFSFDGTGDEFGWHQGSGGEWFLTMYIEHGRVHDGAAGGALKSALREVAGLGCCDFRLTGNQNLVLGSIDESDRARVEAALERHGAMAPAAAPGGLRRNSLACVAMPTCPLAMADGERYLPKLISKLEERLDSHGLADADIVIRMTGCPNGCARPYLGEIGLVGKSPGRYNLYLGAAFDGSRLSRLYRENLDEKGILGELDPIFADYASSRQNGERFGDFVVRSGRAAAPSDAEDFHVPAA